MNYKFIVWYFTICFVVAIVLIPSRKGSGMVLSKINGTEQEYVPCNRDVFTDTIVDRSGTEFYIGYRLNPVTAERKNILVYKK